MSIPMELSFGNGFGCIYEAVKPRRYLRMSLVLNSAWSQQKPWDGMERRGIFYPPLVQFHGNAF